MKAVVIREHGGIQNQLFEDIDTPKPGPGEVLVRIRATGVNHFDHDIREGVSGITHKLPHVPGVEGVGEIAEVGPGVEDVSTLKVYYYSSAMGWVLACDAAGVVQPDGDGWMVVGSRVDHNDTDPKTIEIQIMHFTAII